MIVSYIADVSAYLHGVTVNHFEIFCKSVYWCLCVKPIYLPIDVHVQVFLHLNNKCYKHIDTQAEQSLLWVPFVFQFFLIQFSGVDSTLFLPIINFWILPYHRQTSPISAYLELKHE